MNFKERKRARAEYYYRFIYGWKLRPCTACNGSGRYDNDGSPKCSACNGTGKERYKSSRAFGETVLYWYLRYRFGE